MMTPRLPVALLLALTPACSSEIELLDEETEARETDDSEVDALDPVAIDGCLHTTRLVNLETEAPIAGATVCVANQPGVACSESDADGNVRLHGVGPGPVELEVVHADYWRYRVYDFAFHGAPPTVVRMIDGWTLTDIAAASDDTPDPAQGNLALRFANPQGIGQPGVVAAFYPDPTAGPASGPVALDDDMRSSTNDSTAELGLVAWTNVSPGQHRFTMVHPAVACSSAADPAGIGFDVRIEPGTITTVTEYVCA